MTSTFTATRSRTAANATFNLSRNGTQIGTRATTLSSHDWARTNWEPGIQYVVFRKVSVTNQSISITVPPNGNDLAVINGLQIIASSAVPPLQPAISNLININFGAALGGKTGPAAVGLATNDYWNPCYAPGYTRAPLRA